MGDSYVAKHGDRSLLGKHGDRYVVSPMKQRTCPRVSWMVEAPSTIFELRGSNIVLQIPNISLGYRCIIKIIGCRVDDLDISFGNERTAGCQKNVFRNDLIHNRFDLDPGQIRFRFR